MDSKVNTAFILEAIERLAEIECPRALTETLARQPELLKSEVDSLLTEAIQEQKTLGNMQRVCTLLAVRAFLKDYTSKGLEVALHHTPTLPLAKACPLPILSRPVDDPDLVPNHIVLAQQALHQLRPETEPIWWATVQYVLGQALARVSGDDRAHNLREAARHLELALQAWPDHSTDDRRETLIELDQVWETYALLDPTNHIDEALSFYRQTLETIDAECEPFERALFLRTLGHLYCQHSGDDRAGKVELAVESYQEALNILGRIRDQIDPADLKHWAFTHVDLANTYLERVRGDRTENVEQAIKGYQNALESGLREQSQTVWAMAQYNLAVAYRLRRRENRSENIKKAIEHVQAALVVYTENAFPHRWATVQNELATLYSHQVGDRRVEGLEQAIKYYRAVLNVYTRESFPVQWAQTQNNLGNAYCDRLKGHPLWNLRKAIRCYRQALQVRTRDTYPKQWADTQNNLGTAYAARWATGCPIDFRRAVARYRAALQVRTATTLPQGALQTARNWGQLHFGTQQWSQACEAFSIAIDAAEILYRASYTETSKQVELAENAAIYRQAAFAAARLGEKSQALLILERGKTRLLTEALRWRTPRPDGLLDDVWDAFLQAGDKVHATQYESIAILSDKERDPPIDAYTVREQAAREANTALDNAIKRVREIAPDFFKDLDLSTIFALLPDEQTALVTFCITDQGSVGFVVSHNHKEIQMVDMPGLAARELGTLIQRWINAYQSQDHRYWFPVIELVLAKVGKRLTPVLDALSPDIEKLILLPSGGLFLLPLHAAPFGENGARLLDRYQISYAPSAQVLLRCQEQAAYAQKQGFFAVVNPTGDLDYTESEIQALVPLFLQEHGTVLWHEDATKEKTITLSDGHGYIHFACHGQYNWEEPSRSALLLAESLEKDEEGKTVINYEHALTLAKVQTQLDLSQVRLIILSACETGLSEATGPRSEEYIGLPAGFLMAGAPAVLASLWAVDDLSTALLMERFYRCHLQGDPDRPDEGPLPPASALRRAQQWLRDKVTATMTAEVCRQRAEILKARDDPAYSQALEEQIKYELMGPDSRPFNHPWFWAPFTLSGQ